MAATTAPFLMALPARAAASVAADGYARKEAKMDDKHRAFKRDANIWAASVAQKVLARASLPSSALVAYVDSPQGGTSKVMLKHGVHHSRLLAVSTDPGIERLTRRFRTFRKGNVFNGKVSDFFDDHDGEVAKKVAFFYFDACQAKSECLFRDGLASIIRTSSSPSSSLLALMITMTRRNAHGTLWCNYREVLSELNRHGFIAPGGDGDAGGIQRDFIMMKGNVVTFLVCKRPCRNLLRVAVAPAPWALLMPPCSSSSRKNAMRKKKAKKMKNKEEKSITKRKASKANKARRRCLAEVLATSLANSGATASVFLDLNKTLPPPLLAVLEAAGAERRSFCTNAGKLSAAVKANVTRGRHWPAKTSLSTSAAAAAGFFDGHGQASTTMTGTSAAIFGVLLCYLGFVVDIEEIKRRLTEALALRTTSSATLIWAFECSSQGGVDFVWYNDIVAWLEETHNCFLQSKVTTSAGQASERLQDNKRKSHSPGKAFVMEAVVVCRGGH